MPKADLNISDYEVYPRDFIYKYGFWYADGKAMTAGNWCCEWNVNIDLLSEDDFFYLFKLDKFRRALWVAARPEMHYDSAE